MDFRVPAGESSSVRRVMVIGTVTRERTKSARILLKFPHPCALCRSRSELLPANTSQHLRLCQMPGGAWGRAVLAVFQLTETPMQANAMDTRRSLRATLFLGIGLMAAVDEVLFHQILAWHHFFDRSTPTIGLLSDGLLHAAELLLLAAGFYLFMHLSRAGAVARLLALAEVFIGAGGFHLFGGLVNHRLLRLPQVLYVEELWIYALAWNGFSLVLLAIRFLLWGRA